MVEWIHKESKWCLDGEWRQMNSGLIFYPNKKHVDGNSHGQTFIQWLDSECEDGWEVLKISRDFNSEGQGTWVVFRKEV